MKCFFVKYFLSPEGSDPDHVCSHCENKPYLFYCEAKIIVILWFFYVKYIVLVVGSKIISYLTRKMSVSGSVSCLTFLLSTFRNSSVNYPSLIST